MSKKDTSAKSRTEMEYLDNLSDEDIDLSDIPELTEEDFKRAKPLAEHLAERGITYRPGDPYKVTIHYEDGTSESRIVKPDVITLDPDVRAYFPDSESVNRTLRSLIALIPEREKQS